MLEVVSEYSRIDGCFNQVDYSWMIAPNIWPFPLPRF